MPAYMQISGNNAQIYRVETRKSKWTRNSPRWLWSHGKRFNVRPTWL